MFFHIEHTTEFAYSEPATESFSELRLRPRDNLRQKVFKHFTRIDPAVRIDSYTDYFENIVETVSIPFRHHHLVVTSICDVLTQPFVDALSGLSLTISEARQMYTPHRRELYDFMRPSHYVPAHPELARLSAELLPPTAPFARAIMDLNHHIFSTFKYKPGATDVSTPILEFLEKKEGVCQDFAHLMIAICRQAGIPARYVSGYIETDQPPPESAKTDDEPLVGATASHAWVELCTPTRYWVGLDPTNNILEGERHVQIGIGRDYHDVPPLKGVFKGSDSQSLAVHVRVRRTDAITSGKDQ
jgi:transglutaminase-like putative cysteine protease